jgi:hypothetical protein
MTDKEKKGHESEEQLQDEETENNVITIEMDDGTKKDFIVLDMQKHEGKQYIALAEVDSMEYDIMSWELDGDNVELSVIEDDAEYEAVGTKFQELFDSYDEESED